jgi:hypothetical protein
MINSEDMWRAVHRMEEATQQANQAADRLEEASRKIMFLLEDGYGGNGLRLMLALEKLESKNES